MGLKIRAGVALGGMLLSYFFGVSFLSNLASHLDTTGNVLVDIADGIGFLSKVSSFMAFELRSDLQLSIFTVLSPAQIYSPD